MSSDQNKENPKPMGLLFTTVDAAEQALFTAEDSNWSTVMVDSRAFRTTTSTRN